MKTLRLRIRLARSAYARTQLAVVAEAQSEANLLRAVGAGASARCQICELVAAVSTLKAQIIGGIR